MNERVHKCLYDIKFAIDEIETFFVNRQKSFDVYTGDVLLRRGIERNLEIIGEAVSRILKEEPEYPIDNARRVISMRNQIIHGYDSVSDESIWGIVMNHIPKLKDEVERLINVSSK
jgi:uncharacterized protein with HEPN domain